VKLRPINPNATKQTGSFGLKAILSGKIILEKKTTEKLYINEY